MSSFPPEVIAFNEAMLRFASVRTVRTQYVTPEKMPVETFSLPFHYGDIPHALYRRTNGILANEVWGHTEFTLTADSYGWFTLEYLSWWIRDLSRSREQVQLRSMAMPPNVTTDKPQLGTSLKFIIDHLAAGDDPEQRLVKDIGERARSLNDMLDREKEELGRMLHENR